MPRCPTQVLVININDSSLSVFKDSGLGSHTRSTVHDDDFAADGADSRQCLVRQPSPTMPKPLFPHCGGCFLRDRQPFGNLTDKLVSGELKASKREA